MKKKEVMQYIAGYLEGYTDAQFDDIETSLQELADAHDALFDRVAALEESEAKS